MSANGTLVVWFRILRSPSEKDYYLYGPPYNPKPQTQTTNLELVDDVDLLIFGESLAKKDMNFH